MAKRTARTPAARQRRLEERLRITTLTLLRTALHLPAESLEQPFPITAREAIKILRARAAGITELTESTDNKDDAACTDGL